jgi:hypothetical protein
MWKSQNSAKKYIDPTYMFDRMLASFFDFLIMNVQTPQFDFMNLVTHVCTSVFAWQASPWGHSPSSSAPCALCGAHDTF